MYKIVGADRKEYGPVTADQLREWIAQGRANAQTIVRFEEGPWKPLGTYPEFAPLVSTSSTPPPLGGTIGQSLGAPQPIFIQQPALPQSNSMAVAGLTFGILGLFCCPVIGAVLAIVFSSIGLNQIKKEPERYTTATIIPTVGLILGVIGLTIVPLKLFWSFNNTPFRPFRNF
jgi:hypothetical protein